MYILVARTVGGAFVKLHIVSLSLSLDETRSTYIFCVAIIIFIYFLYMEDDVEPNC